MVQTTPQITPPFPNVSLQILGIQVISDNPVSTLFILKLSFLPRGIWVYSTCESALRAFFLNKKKTWATENVLDQHSRLPTCELKTKYFGVHISSSSGWGSKWTPVVWWASWLLLTAGVMSAREKSISDVLCRIAYRPDMSEVFILRLDECA